MRGTKAKEIRRKVFGSSSGNNRDLREYSKSTNTGTIYADFRRRVYQIVKKEGLERIKELMAQDGIV